MYVDELLPFVIPATMYAFGGDHSLADALKQFLIVILSGGFMFMIIGANAGHHHPEIVHDGDKIRWVEWFLNFYFERKVQYIGLWRENESQKLCNVYTILIIFRKFVAVKEMTGASIL